MTSQLGRIQLGNVQLGALGGGRVQAIYLTLAGTVAPKPVSGTDTPRE